VCCPGGRAQNPECNSLDIAAQHNILSILATLYAILLAGKP